MIFFAVVAALGGAIYIEGSGAYASVASSEFASNTAGYVRVAPRPFLLVGVIEMLHLYYVLLLRVCLFFTH